MFNQVSKKVFFGLVLAAALTVAALAQNGSEQKVEFYLDGKVGSEVVKKGTYKIAIPETEQGTIEIKIESGVTTLASEYL